MKTLFRAGFVAVALLTSSVATYAAGPEVNATSTDLALRGVDPVSYFTSGAPQDGDFGITAVHEGAVYRFVSEANRDLFQKDPAKYLPQYGGYCAFAAALGKKFDGDPKVWKIVNDKLYLNVAPAVAEKWNADQANMITQANEMWPKIKSVPFADIK
jgi:ABC-type transport system substrate-binding protein